MNTLNENSWVKDFFQSCIGKPIRQKRKVFAREYLKEGKYPVVDQGQDFISGWTNDEDVLIQDDLPLIIFGDHTRAFKFINFPFAAGADGTQILKPCEDLSPSFFYYRCLAIDIPSKGYSRHFKILKENEFTYPVSKPEQLRIAAILHKIQKAIEVEDKLIQTTRELKKSTMKQLFTHGLRGEKLKETEIGLVPESWAVKKLEQVTTIERGKFSHRPRNDPDYYGGRIPFVQTGDVVRSGGRITTYSQTLNEKGLSVSRLFPKGTILITIAANIGDTGILEFDSAFPDSIIGMTPFDGIFSEYLEYYLRTQKQKMDEQAPKGTQKNINIEFLRPWPVPIPGVAEQKEIAHILQTIDQKIEIHEKKKSTLQDLFKTMLHKLMTAEIRVHDLEIDTSEVV